MLSQSEIIKRAIERVADAEIEKKTAPCFRTYKAIVTEAPNGTTCKVRLIGDDTELTLPYASKLGELTVGKYVWVGAFYNVDNSFSNAIVWETLKMDVSGGGSSVTVDDALSTTSTNPVQNRVITNTVNALPHDGIYYLTDNGSEAAVTAKPYYASRWITTNNNVTSYFNGMTVAVKVPVAGNGTYGTVLSINGLGEHPVIRNVSTMVSTTYGVGSMLVLTYDANASGSAYINSNSATTIQGVWKVSDYDTTIVYRLLQYYTTPAVNTNAGSLYRYEICFSKLDGTIVPANNVSNKATTYTKVLNDEPFDPFGNIYYYQSTTTVAAGDPVASNTLYRVYLGDIRYSFNINSSGTEGTTALTAHEPIFIKALYNKTTKMATLTQDLTSSNYLVRSGLVQALPSSDPNTGLASNQMYIYILLGYAYNKYQFDMAVLHQVYAWDDEVQATVIYHGEDSNAFHKTDIIPLENGGTGLDGGTGLNWYNSTILHPHFAVVYNIDNGNFLVYYRGSLTDITSLQQFISSDYYRAAVRETAPILLGSFSGQVLGSALVSTGAFVENDMTKLYIIFPDGIQYNGVMINGIKGQLTYDEFDGVYLTNLNVSIPSWVTPFDTLEGYLNNKEDTSNKVTSISSSSTDTEYPSAKAVYDLFNSIVDADNVSF